MTVEEDNQQFMQRNPLWQWKVFVDPQTLTFRAVAINGYTYAGKAIVGYSTTTREATPIEIMQYLQDIQ